MRKLAIGIMAALALAGCDTSPASNAYQPPTTYAFPTATSASVGPTSIAPPPAARTSVVAPAPATKTQNGGELRGTMKLVEKTCKQAVEAQLKSPGSADYSDVNTHQDNDAGTAWTVTGKVDSDNLFGASIRNLFECMATYDIEAETVHARLTSFTGN